MLTTCWEIRPLAADKAGREGRSIAALVVTHNSVAVLGASLDSLTVNVESERGLSVVVDNGSTAFRFSCRKHGEWLLCSSKLLAGGLRF